MVVQLGIDCLGWIGSTSDDFGSRRSLVTQFVGCLTACWLAKSVACILSPFSGLSPVLPSRWITAEHQIWRLSSVLLISVMARKVEEDETIAVLIPCFLPFLLLPGL